MFLCTVIFKYYQNKHLINLAADKKILITYHSRPIPVIINRFQWILVINLILVHCVTGSIFILKIENLKAQMSYVKSNHQYNIHNSEL